MRTALQRRCELRRTRNGMRHLPNQIPCSRRCLRQGRCHRGETDDWPHLGYARQEASASARRAAVEAERVSELASQQREPAGEPSCASLGLIFLVILIRGSTWLVHPKRNLRQHVLHHVAVNICQPIVAALEFTGEPFVVNAREVSLRCVSFCRSPHLPPDADLPGADFGLPGGAMISVSPAGSVSK